MPQQRGHQHRQDLLVPTQQQAVAISHQPAAMTCCVPSGCSQLDKIIDMQKLTDCVKIICNNESCSEGRYMHRECFEVWQESLLSLLRSMGRARSWSEKQRMQNLWTKKGYDLAFRACGCRCGKGHLRKDLDWIPPRNVQETTAATKRKRNRKRTKNDKPTLMISTALVAPAVNHKNHGNSVTNGSSNGNTNAVSRLRTSSLSSTESIESPTISSSDSQSGELEQVVQSLKKFGVFGTSELPPIPRRARHDSGSIFQRRLDYSSFDKLARSKMNSYNIIIDDDDETRHFLLSTLSSHGANHMSCAICRSVMYIYGKFPLLDGTFFVSPRKHSTDAVTIKRPTLSGQQYLNAICLDCLSGSNGFLSCRSCQTKWSGGDLRLGSMYSYDIFASFPCCIERLRCNKCAQLVIPARHRLQFFSDYSQATTCASCGSVDHHFVKPLQVTYVHHER